MYDEYLAHYGVKGMKWGKRKNALLLERRIREQKMQQNKLNAAKAIYGGDPSKQGYLDKKGNYRSYSKLRTYINNKRWEAAKKKVGAGSNYEHTRIQQRAKTMAKNQKKQKVDDFINSIFKKKRRK